ncbi:ABC transporter permease subunit [Butyrivibrio sp.]|uniref:ABC transporter permease subunit n=1 Tax=Butyrivibrio sp. TaxID=28121 RepID=UPI0025BCEFDF|nr:ABC transporter permease subunit [Butyrivibrio sp.]MBQ9305850.1 sugar ABC transporter permease [Butyrivibrio sp.]
MKQKNGKKNKKRIGSAGGLIALSLPTIVWYVAFCYLPLFGIIIAFKRYKPVPGRSFINNLFIASPWVGFENFRFLFINPQIKAVVRNTLAYNITFLIIDTVLPIALAVMLSYLYSDRLKGMTQSIAMLPHFMSWVVVSMFLFAFLSTDKGLLNNALIELRKEPLRWYQEPVVWPFILVVTHTWKAYGYALVMYMANIASINTGLYESAMVDGASAWQMVLRITLPLIRPIVIVILLLNLGGILNTDFGLFYQATRNSGSIISTTQTIDVYTYKALMEQANYGYSASASLIQNAIGCVFLIIANLLIRKANPEEGIF